MEVSVRNVLCITLLISIKFLAVYCKCRCIKYMKGTINERIFHFFDLFFCTLCYSFVIESCDLICTFRKSFTPVSINCCAVKHTLYCVCIIYTPVHRCRSKCCVRSNRCHINIITYTWNSCCFACCRSTCCICMLADQYTAVRDQSICALFLKVKACPAVCIFYFHCYRRAYALRAKIESCITGDNLCVWECTYITHLACVFFYCAVLDHFIQFQTCNYT